MPAGRKLPDIEGGGCGKQGGQRRPALLQSASLLNPRAPFVDLDLRSMPVDSYALGRQ